MSEYLVVTGALFGAFFVVDNVECPTHDNCLSALSAAIHDRYQGFSYSISEVQSLPSVALSTGIVDEIPPNDAPDGEEDDSVPPGSGTPITEQQGVSRQTLVTTDLGETFVLGTDGTTVSDFAGQVVGSYAGTTLTTNGGSSSLAQVSDGVVDRSGTTLEPQALVCDGEVADFVYQDSVTGTLHDSVTLLPINNNGNCSAPSSFKQMTDEEGNPIEKSVLFDGLYYVTFEGDPNPAGEVVDANFTVPDDPDKYGENAGRVINECVVLPISWNEGYDDDIEAYLAVVDNDFELGYSEGVCDSAQSIDG